MLLCGSVHAYSMKRTTCSERFMHKMVCNSTFYQLLNSVGGGKEMIWVQAESVDFLRIKFVCLGGGLKFSCLITMAPVPIHPLQLWVSTVCWKNISQIPAVIYALGLLSFGIQNSMDHNICAF